MTLKFLQSLMISLNKHEEHTQELWDQLFEKVNECLARGEGESSAFYHGSCVAQIELAQKKGVEIPEDMTTKEAK
jgi:hypothetical protein